MAQPSFWGIVKLVKNKLAKFSERYQAALQKHLKQDRQTGVLSAKRLGSQAVADGLDASDLVKIHEQALIELMPRDSVPAAVRNGMIGRASKFFADTIKPVVKAHRAAVEANIRLKKLNEELNRDCRELGATNRKLKREIIRRKAAEKALAKSERHHTQLLDKSRRMREQIRHLSRQVLLSREAERKAIRRDLSDQIAQVLRGG